MDNLININSRFQEIKGIIINARAFGSRVILNKARVDLIANPLLVRDIMEQIPLTKRLVEK